MSLLRAREAVMLNFRPMLRGHAITDQQWRVLRALTTVTEAEITELAHVAHLLPSSLTRILRDLEARNFIRRRIADNDARRTVVSISRKGSALIESLSPAAEAIYATIATEFGADRLSHLEDQLRDLERKMLELAAASIVVVNPLPSRRRATRPRGTAPSNVR
jgi:homoprotocatechuate degradation regulator HpaR